MTAPVVVLVVCPARGHVPDFAVIYERAFRAAGWHTALIGPELAAISRGDLEGKRAKDGVHVRWCPPAIDFGAAGPLVSALRRVALWDAVARAVRAAEKRLNGQIDLVFLPWADPFLRAAKLRFLHPVLRRRFRYRWTGVLTHPLPDAPHDPTIGFLRKRAVFTDRCVGMIVLDRSQIATRCKVPQFVAPDCCDVFGSGVEPAFLRLLRERARGRKVLCLPCDPARRKNLDLFLELSRRAELREFFFVIAGKPLTQAASDALARARDWDNVGIHPFDLEPAELDSLIAFSDALFLVYENHPGSSNLLTRAAFHETPSVVGRQAPVMRERVERYGLGIAIDVPPSATDLVDLRALLQGEGRWSPGFASYREAHSFERLVAVVRELTSSIATPAAIG